MTTFAVEVQQGTIAPHHESVVQHETYEQSVSKMLQTMVERPDEIVQPERIGKVVMDAYNELEGDLLPIMVRSGRHFEAETRKAQGIVLPKTVHATNGPRLVVLDSTGPHYRERYSVGNFNYPIVPEDVAKDAKVDPDTVFYEDRQYTLPILAILEREFKFRNWSRLEHPEASPAAKVAQHIVMDPAPREILYSGLHDTPLIREDMHFQGFSPEQIDAALEELKGYHEKPIKEVQSDNKVAVMSRVISSHYTEAPQLPHRVPGLH